MSDNEETGAYAPKKRKVANPKVQKWLDHFATYDREFKKWDGRVEKILKRYRDEIRSGNRGNQESRFNILWSNVQTLIPAVFARLPRPEVTRRFNDPDPVGRVASLILERALDYEVQHYPDFRATMRQCVHDRFLGGRGTAWIRYEPHMKAERTQMPTDGLELTEDVDEGENADEAAVTESLDYECAPVDYVHWKDFGHTVARTWEEVTAVWRCVYLTEDAAESRFGEKIAAKLSYDKAPEDLNKTYGGKPEDEHRAAVYEIWDKSTKKVTWLSKGMKEILDERDDPLGLEEFFPCPRPLFATLTNESLIPVPDFSLYQDQANQLDILCDRIDGLVKALQVKGVYDGANTELGRLFTEGENGTLIPVKNWAAFAEKNGLKGSFELVDLDPIGRALKEAYGAFEMVKQQVYEITGISDIIRGQTEASETATAQQIKGQYAQLRLRNMQADVAMFASELIQLKAQVMCGKFDPMTVVQIAAAEQLAPEDQQLIGPALQLLFGERVQNPESNAPNPMRSFRVEVASDSMVQIDENEEKKNRSEFLTAAAGYIKNVAPVMGEVPPLADVVMEMLKFTVQGMKAGRAIEGKFDQATQKVVQMANAPKPPPPEMQKLQAEIQAKQAEMQMQQQTHQMDLQAEAQKHTQEMQFEREKHQIEMGMKMQEMQMTMGQQKEEHEQNLTFERQKLAAEKPETAPVGPDGKGAASPMMQMAAQMTQATQLMAQAMAQMNKLLQASLQASNSPKRLTRDPVTGEKMVVPVQMQ